MEENLGYKDWVVEAVAADDEDVAVAMEMAAVFEFRWLWRRCGFYSAGKVFEVGSE